MSKKNTAVSETWRLLIDELTAVDPKMDVVHNRMKSLGLRVSDDLVVCMERALAKMESLERRQISQKQGADHEF